MEEPERDEAAPAATTLPPLPVRPTRVLDIAASTDIPSSAPMSAPSTPTMIPTASPPLQTGIALPDPTAVPRVVLAVPNQWLIMAEEAVLSMSSLDLLYQWELISDADPGQLLARNQADIALVPGKAGTAVLQTPIILAVPFATEWESITLADAQQILQEGHPLVSRSTWREIRASQKALSVDGQSPTESGYPLNEEWSLESAPEYEAVLVELAAKLRQQMALPPLVHLTAVGDIMLDRSLGNTIQAGNLGHPFEKVVHLLEDADVTIGNLESALGDAGQPAQKRYTFRAPPAAAESLALAGFDLISLANNHAMDYGPDTLLQAISLLQEQGVTAVGAGANESEARALRVRQIGQIKVGFLAYVNVPVEVGGFDTYSWTATADEPGLAWGNVADIAADVSTAADAADLLVVLLHSGLEYIDAPSEAQMAAAHAAVDAGAAIVIGHHSHLLQGVEFYQDGVIVYGLGNFAFQIEGEPSTAILDVWLDESGVRQISFTPVVIQVGGQPRLAEPVESGSIRRHIYHQTTLLNAP